MRRASHSTAGDAPTIWSSVLRPIDAQLHDQLADGLREHPVVTSDLLGAALGARETGNIGPETTLEARDEPRRCPVKAVQRLIDAEQAAIEPRLDARTTGRRGHGSRH